MTVDWRWPNFSSDELKCHHCGVYAMQPEFMDKLQALRTEYGKSMKITSGYRCPVHNAKVSTTGANGPHTTGQAVDVQCSGADAYRLMSLAIKHGFTGIGVAQKGPHDGRFLHLDTLAAPNYPRPNVWTYK